MAYHVDAPTHTHISCSLAISHSLFYSQAEDSAGQGYPGSQVYEAVVNPEAQQCKASCTSSTASTQQRWQFSSHNMAGGCSWGHLSRTAPPPAVSKVSSWPPDATTQGPGMLPSRVLPAGGLQYQQMPADGILSTALAIALPVACAKKAMCDAQAASPTPCFVLIYTPTAPSNISKASSNSLCLFVFEDGRRDN